MKEHRIDLFTWLTWPSRFNKSYRVNMLNVGFISEEVHKLLKSKDKCSSLIIDTHMHLAQLSNLVADNLCATVQPILWNPLLLKM